MAKAETSVTKYDQTQFQGLVKTGGDSVALLRSLTEDVVNLEAAVGRALWETGKKLGTIRSMLKEKGTTGAWEKWCEFFAYSKDYANRMIQVAEVFKDAEAVPSNLTFRHFREVARFNYHAATESDVAKLAQLVSAAGLNTKDTRQLVSAANAGKIDLDLDSLSEESPKLRKELEIKLQAAREMGTAESAARLEELQTRIGTMEEHTKSLEDIVMQKATRITQLADQVKFNDAAVKIGEGDPEVGKLKIELEQATQAKDIASAELKEVARDASQARQALDRLMNSPAGQARVDAKKCFEDLVKIFKDSMTPAYLSLRVHRANSPETVAAVLSVVSAIEEWCKLVRTQLATVTPAPIVVEAILD